MARTLIIRNASFLANKVATVTFTSVPCTGIALASDTITITGVQPVEVEYTVAPSDTTDTVTWASSNTDIITVSDGVITVVGVGECTLTVTCGSYSDTASVSVTINADLNWYPNMFSNNASAHVLYWSGTATTRASAYGQGDQAGQYGIYNVQDASSNYPVIKLPGNTRRVKISVTDATVYHNSDATKLYWMKDISAGWSGSTQAAYCDSVETAYNIRTETEKIFTVPEGINAIVFDTRLGSDQSSIDAMKATIAASGLKLEFLPPAE